MYDGVDDDNDKLKISLPAFDYIHLIFNLYHKSLDFYLSILNQTKKTTNSLILILLLFVEIVVIQKRKTTPVFSKKNPK